VKTISLKKVSAVAVASLGFGLLSVVPANAAATASVYGNVTGISLAKTSPAVPVVGTAVVVTATQTYAAVADPADAAGRTINFVGIIESAPVNGATTVAAGNGTLVTCAVAACTQTATANRMAILQANTGTIAAANTGTNTWTFTPTKAGVYNLKVWHDLTPAAATVGDLTWATNELYQNISITVAAAATYSNTLSTAFISYGAGNTAPSAATTAAPISQTATKGGLDATDDKAASIDVVINNTSNAAYTSGASLSAEISGPGYLVWENGAATGVDKCLVAPQYGANTGRSLAARAVDAQSAIFVCADGTSGVATVTLKITDADDAVYTLATRTVTFFGAVSKIVATGVLTNARAGGATATGTAVADRDLATEVPAVIVYATDKNGVGVTGLTVTAKSSDTAVMNSAFPTAFAEDIKSTANIFSSGGAGYYNIAVQAATGSLSGQKATMTFRVVDPAGDGTTFLTSDVAFTLGGSVATEVISFDKTAYAPGEAMVVTITAKDSSGNPVYDGAATPTAGILSSKAAVGLPTTASSYVAGKKAFGSTGGVFAPSLPGSFVLSATGTDAAATVRTATATVTDANAGLLTQIDALNAKIVALNALIAKIMKKLGVK
jgi:hypothetical protein